jgi:hypothetical protein
MQVRFLGFNFSTDCTMLNLKDYVNHMIDNHGTAHRFGEHDRSLYFDSNYSEKYHLGLMVTVKDQKKFCELINNSGHLVVKVNALDDNSNLMDFNFFVINKITGFGMYQYYHQSCSLNAFGYFNNRRFSEFQEGKIKLAIAEIPESEQTEKKQKSVKKQYKGSLKYEMLIRQENLNALIMEFQHVKAFEYCLTTLTVPEPTFEPLRNYVDKERTKISFNVTTPTSILASIIPNFVRAHDINNGKIIGTDDEGIERVLRIMNNPDSYGEYSYDDVAPKINSLDISLFYKSWVITELLKACDEHNHIFEATVK